MKKSKLIKLLSELSEAVSFLPTVDTRTANANAKAVYALNKISKKKTIPRYSKIVIVLNKQYTRKSPRFEGLDY